MTKGNLMQALKSSDYWTWFTEWLLSFGGKAAWPILILCTLYMGAQLYPGVNLPAGLNFAVFLTQLFALDMGGMGLVSIARQAKDAGQEEAAKEADQFGKVLVGISITSLVTVGTGQFLSGVPALNRGGGNSIMAMDIEPCIMVVEFILVIARVVCSVLYGKVMHALKHIGQIEQQPAVPPAPPVDVEALVRRVIDETATKLQGEQAQANNLLRIELQSLLGKIQDIENRLPAIDYQALAVAIVAGQRSGQSDTPTGQAAITDPDGTGHIDTEQDRGQADMTGEQDLTGQDTPDRTEPGSSQAEQASAPDTGHAAEIISLADRRRTGQRPGHRTGGQQPDAEQEAAGQQPTGQDSEPDTSDLAARIIAYRTEHPQATQADIARYLGMSERNLRRKMAAMRREKVSGQ